MDNKLVQLASHAGCTHGAHVVEVDNKLAQLASHAGCTHGAHVMEMDKRISRSDSCITDLLQHAELNTRVHEKLNEMTAVKHSEIDLHLAASDVLISDLLAHAELNRSAHAKLQTLLDVDHCPNVLVSVPPSCQVNTLGHVKEEQDTLASRQSPVSLSSGNALTHDTMPSFDDPRSPRPVSRACDAAEICRQLNNLSFEGPTAPNDRAEMKKLVNNLHGAPTAENVTASLRYITHRSGVMSAA